ncbi:MAG TPA: MMPL family transporter [Gaiellaceae bacterium]|nr:MMPL family transporter [Gaiellaceae bacterium]
MGRWSASHWKTAVFGWLVFVVVVFMAGNKVGANYLDQNDNNVGQAHRADQILKSAFPEKDPQSEFVLIQSTKLTAGDPAFRAVVRDVQRSVAPLPGITNFRTPYEGGHADQISAGRHSVIVQWEMKGTADEAKKKIDAVTAATAKVATRHPSFYVGEAGAVSSGKAIDEMFSKQLKNAGTRSVPLTLIILLLVFGSLVAAFIPLLLALSSVIATIGLVAFVSKVTPMDQSVSEVILLIGLAVGVDYTLFYLKREREERAAGKGHRAALEAAAATSGRAVLVSGATVLVAMAGLIFTRDRTFVSFGIGTMLVVLVSMIGSLTVLPALLSKLGDRVEKGRVPFLGRLRRPSGENRVWSKVLTPALRHPGIAALLSVGVLGAMAVPVLHLHTAESGLAALPKSAPTVETLDRIQASFTGSTQPAEVAVKTPSTDSAEFKNALLALRGKVHASPLMHGPVDVVVNPAHTVARIEIPLAGSGTDSTSERALAQLRDNALPATVGAVPGTEWAVTGNTAGSHDYNAMMKSSAVYVFGFVLLFAFLLLLASFRSVVIAAKAVVLNLLSVGAAYGLVIVIFQWGWGENLLDFKSNGGVASWLPVFMFVILFGLSMDYHVFILSRVREAFDRGLSTEEAVAHGIKTTAGTVSSAALVMVGAFGIFATLPFLDFKEMGIGLAAAVLIDATIVRAVLLPATMKLLGDWNWYLPKWLQWLPKIDHGAGAEPVAA